MLEWREKGPILPTPFKCFQGEKGPIQLLEVEEVLWRTLVRYLSSDIDVEEKKGLVFNQAQGHLHHLFFFWVNTGGKKKKNKEENAESKMNEKPQEALCS